MVLSNLNSIVCTDRYGGIGKDGTIPWFHDKQVEKERRLDLSIFRYYTENSFVICGRTTYESLSTLKNRTLCVLTKNKSNLGDYTFSTLPSLLDFINKHPYNIFWCIGGGSLYEQLIPLSRKVIKSELTQVYYDCDTFLHMNMYLSVKFGERKNILNLPTITTMEYLQ